jgi:hypothetical protein
MPTPCCQRALAGALDHRAFGHRIGKRHAEFQDIGAARHQGVHQRHGQFGAWITGGNEGDQRGFVLRLQGGESCCDFGHVFLVCVKVTGT